MAQFKPGDRMKHLVTGEEGIFKSSMPWTAGNNHGEGIIVEVAGHNRLWLLEETAFLERPAPKQGP